MTGISTKAKARDTIWINAFIVLLLFLPFRVYAEGANAVKFLKKPDK
jgi:hypothetical protein